MKLKRVPFSTTVLLAALFSNAWAVKDIDSITSGSNSFAQLLVNLLSGPWGLAIAFFGILGAFFESRFSESKSLILVTILFTVGPFLLAMALKGLYMQ